VDEVGLAPHAELLQDAGRADVPGVQAADDPMQPEIVEAEGERQFGGLRSEPLSVVVGMEDEPDLALAVDAAQPVQMNLADHPVDLRPDHRERDALPVVVEPRLTDLLVEDLSNLGRAARLPVEVASHVRVRVDRGEVVEVSGRIGPQYQPCAPQRVVRS